MCDIKRSHKTILFLYSKFDDYSPAFHPGIAALSAYLSRFGIPTDLFVADQANTVGQFKEKLQEARPLLIACSIITSQWPHIKPYLKAIKEADPGLFTICGGWHPTICPEEVINFEPVDAICLGEGEEALYELVSRYSKGEDISCIKNIWLKQDGRTFRNELRPLLKNLDSLPYWDRELFGIDKVLSDPGYAFWPNEKTSLPIATGRGCPYNCTFCGNGYFRNLYKGKGKYVRKRSIANIIHELKFFKDNFAIEQVEFWDEMFALNDVWVQKFTQEYEHEINLPFIAALHPERMTEKNLFRLRKAGCSWIFTGIETGNEKFRKNHLNKNVSNKVIKKAFYHCKRMGINIFCWVMIGLPYENEELIKETYQFCEYLEPDYVGCSIFRPYAGTTLFELCKRKNYLTDLIVNPYSDKTTLKLPFLSQSILTYYFNLFNSLNSR